VFVMNFMMLISIFVSPYLGASSMNFLTLCMCVSVIAMLTQVKEAYRRPTNVGGGSLSFAKEPPGKLKGDTLDDKFMYGSSYLSDTPC
jgi:hypothetical protein